MATPCTHDPNEVIEKVVSAKNNADKFDKFVNGTDTQTVQLGTGSPTPTIRNAVRQIMADASWAKQFIADAPEGDVSLNNATAMGTSASRTLAERFADYVNVKDFGAKGDGSNDDTAEIQAALNYAITNEKNVFFPSGTYLISSNILIDSWSGAVIYGAGAYLEGANLVIKRVKYLTINGLSVANNSIIFNHWVWFSSFNNMCVSRLVLTTDGYTGTTYWNEFNTCSFQQLEAGVASEEIGTYFLDCNANTFINCTFSGNPRDRFTRTINNYAFIFGNVRAFSPFNFIGGDISYYENFVQFNDASIKGTINLYGTFFDTPFDIPETPKLFKINYNEVYAWSTNHLNATFSVEQSTKAKTNFVSNTQSYNSGSFFNRNLLKNGNLGCRLESYKNAPFMFSSNDITITSHSDGLFGDYVRLQKPGGLNSNPGVTLMSFFQIPVSGVYTATMIVRNHAGSSIVTGDNRLSLYMRESSSNNETVDNQYSEIKVHDDWCIAKAKLRKTLEKGNSLSVSFYGSSETVDGITSYLPFDVDITLVAVTLGDDFSVCCNNTPRDEIEFSRRVNVVDGVAQDVTIASGGRHMITILDDRIKAHSFVEFAPSYHFVNNGIIIIPNTSAAGKLEISLYNWKSNSVTISSTATIYIRVKSSVL